MFHSFHGLMNSINWPASNVWVFIAQLGEHCSANAEATGSNPVEAPKSFFSGYFRNCLNCDSLRWSHTHFISSCYICPASRASLEGMLYPKLPEESIFRWYPKITECCLYEESSTNILNQITHAHHQLASYLLDLLISVY